MSSSPSLVCLLCDAVVPPSSVLCLGRHCGPLPRQRRLPRPLINWGPLQLCRRCLKQRAAMRKTMPQFNFLLNRKHTSHPPYIMGLCIPTNPDYGTWHLNERQLEYVRMSGLYHLAQTRWIRIDHALITGLVERWRPETNTFHFSTGEATVKFEDVAYIYGLQINGAAVTGKTFPQGNVADV